MKTKDKPLHHLDLLMWNVNHPTGLTNITSMMFFKTTLKRQNVIRVIEERIGRFDKFKSKVVHQNDKPTWHKDKLFDINSHVHSIALPGKGGDKALQDLISDLISSPLDYSKPLWQIHIIENYKGGSALVWRIHHAIGDGASLMKVFLSLTDHYTEDHKIEQTIDFVEVNKKALTWSERLKQASNLTKDIFSFSKDMVKHPEKLKDIAKAAGDTIKDVASFATTSNNENSIYKGELGVQKKVAWSNTINLDDIKKIGKHFEATVNDTLLTALTGAIRRHMEAHGEDTSIHFNLACPVDMRHNEKGIHLGNKVGVILLELPVNIISLEERFQTISEKTTKLKKSLEPVVAYYYTQLLSDFIPKQVEEAGAKFLGSKLMGLLSNVPGPKEQLLFAGEEVDNIMFWLPHTYEMGLGFSVVSYNNKVIMGITVDSKVVKDPEVLIQNFEIEIDHMLMAIEG